MSERSRKIIKVSLGMMKGSSGCLLSAFLSVLVNSFVAAAGHFSYDLMKIAAVLVMIAAVLWGLAHTLFLLVSSKALRVSAVGYWGTILALFYLNTRAGEELLWEWIGYRYDDLVFLTLGFLLFTASAACLRAVAALTVRRDLQGRAKQITVAGFISAVAACAVEVWAPRSAEMVMSVGLLILVVGLSGLVSQLSKTIRAHRPEEYLGGSAL